MLFDDLKPAFRRVDLMDMKNICGLFAGKDLVCMCFKIRSRFDFQNYHLNQSSGLLKSIHNLAFQPFNLQPLF